MTSEEINEVVLLNEWYVNIEYLKKTNGRYLLYSLNILNIDSDLERIRLFNYEDDCLFVNTTQVIVCSHQTVFASLLYNKELKVKNLNELFIYLTDRKKELEKEVNDVELEIISIKNLL